MERKMLYLTLGIIILGLLIFAKASSRPRVSSANQETTSQVPDKWRMFENRSPMDDSITISAELDAEDKINGPVEAIEPTLIVRCKGQLTEVYLYTGMPSSIETGYDGGVKNYHTLRLKLDDGEPTFTAWDDSTDHKTLFLRSLTLDPMSFHDAIPFAKQLAKASKLAIEFTPFESVPEVVRFDVRGGEAHLNKVGQACGWSVD